MIAAAYSVELLALQGRSVGCAEVLRRFIPERLHADPWYILAKDCSEPYGKLVGPHRQYSVRRRMSWLAVSLRQQAESCLESLQPSDVVTWNGSSYFASTVVTDTIEDL